MPCDIFRASSFIDVLGPASAEADVPAHCGDRGEYVTTVTQPPSTANREPAVNATVIAHNFCKLFTISPAVTSSNANRAEDMTKMIPLPSFGNTREYERNTREYERDDCDYHNNDTTQHDDDFDPAWDHAQAYNDYCRELEE